MRNATPVPAAKQQQPRTPNIIRAGMNVLPLACTLLESDFGCSL